jgi:hypothetical protein
MLVRKAVCSGKEQLKVKESPCVHPIILEKQKQCEEYSAFAGYLCAIVRAKAKALRERPTESEKGCLCVQPVILVTTLLRHNTFFLEANREAREGFNNHSPASQCRGYCGP